MNLREIYNQFKDYYYKIMQSEKGIYVSLFCFIFCFLLSFWLENPIFKLPVLALSFWGWLNFLKQFQINKMSKK
jgi:hypothetical protein